MKKKIIGIVLTFFVVVSTLLTIFAFRITPVTLKRDTFVYEYGTPISNNPADYVNANANVINEVQLNFSNLKNEIGVYKVSASYAGVEFPFYIKIQDTTKPVVTLKQVVFNVNLNEEIMTKSAKETNMNELITAMVGRVLENRFPPVDNQPGDVVLSVQHLSTKFEPYLQDVSFDVHEGEIFGLYGLVGAGRTELLETIFGIRTRAAGRVYLNNKLMNFSCAKEAMDYGFALITEERKANGLFLKGDLTFNTTIANLNAYKKGVAISDPKMVKATSNEIKIMHTKCMGPGDMISSLSGGNQQKVIFGKWLERGPQVFMMDEPTRGIDVGAKYEIYELIIQMAKQGKTIIVVSSEMPEILGITNRIGVMSNGHLSGIVNTKETNQEELLRLSAKYL